MPQILRQPPESWPRGLNPHVGANFTTAAAGGREQAPVFTQAPLSGLVPRLSTSGLLCAGSSSASQKSSDVSSSLSPLWTLTCVNPVQVRVRIWSRRAWGPQLPSTVLRGARGAPAQSSPRAWPKATQRTEAGSPQPGSLCLALSTVERARSSSRALGRGAVRGGAWWEC